jgi:hypothetical protein
MDYGVCDLFWTIINFAEILRLIGESSASINWTSHFRICARSPDNLSEIFLSYLLQRKVSAAIWSWDMESGKNYTLKATSFR